MEPHEAKRFLHYKAHNHTSEYTAYRVGNILLAMRLKEDLYIEHINNSKIK